ncbi:S1 family peptidase [Mycobacterium parmense]|uniref:Uncharacterized protein n=1 Tax=Mycobacterium parmense TaxID=185642 RepID=A0A7I7Z5W0_9MYCO|nr:S1 family peptidase [Mycobacterium parmense]MCV7349392.1 trypsin [Mycobacterium parmense]ORW57337.1 trypsin [Mycobacterium parmense]BBZ48261.1 hypothetical protein MPRM_55420 [Mycobacterium parmense]
MWSRALAVIATAVIGAGSSAGPVLAEGNPPAPGAKIEDDNSACTAAFAARGNDDAYYLMTSGHCDSHDGSVWTYGDDNVPLGRVSAQEYEENGDTGTQRKDAAIIRLDQAVGVPVGDVAGRYPVRNALGFSQIQVGMPFCKVGAVTGETCGAVTGTEGNYAVETNVYSLPGDSGSPGFVKNADGTVSAVGILTSSPEGDDHTTYFVLVEPLLSKWGLHILP